MHTYLRVPAPRTDRLVVRATLTAIATAASPQDGWHAEITDEASPLCGVQAHARTLTGAREALAREVVVVLRAEPELHDLLRVSTGLSVVVVEATTVHSYGIDRLAA